MVKGKTAPRKAIKTRGKSRTIRKGYCPVNGLELYYEIHGRGLPLVLLHGGMGTIEMFSPRLSVLSAARMVIAVELQAHGHTADIDRPLRYESMAEDVVGLLKFLKIKQADVMGYSLGGGTALQIAIRHPEIVRKLILVSFPMRRNGWYPEVLESFDHMGPELAEMMKPSPVYQSYASVAPRPGDFPVLIGRIGELQRREYDWSREVASITAPTLLVAADADSIRTAHTVEFFELLGGGQHDAGLDGSQRPKSQLAILPGTSHYDIFSAPGLMPMALEFLDGPKPEHRSRSKR